MSYGDREGHGQHEPAFFWDFTRKGEHCLIDGRVLY